MVAQRARGRPVFVQRPERQ